MWKRRTRREVVVVVVLMVEMMVAGSGRRLEEEFVDGLLLKCRTTKEHKRWRAHKPGVDDVVVPINLEISTL